LIVDDNRTNRRILEQCWSGGDECGLGGKRREGTGTTSRCTGKRTTIHADADGHAYAGMDGLPWLKISEKGRVSTATIMMLLQPDTEAMGAMPEAGIAAYLLKPVRQAELREAIARRWEQGQKGAVPLITRYSLQDARARRALYACCSRRIIQSTSGSHRGCSKAWASGKPCVEWTRGARSGEKTEFRPGLDGCTDARNGRIEATAAIREWEKQNGKRVPVIALTAHAMKAIRNNVWRWDGRLPLQAYRRARTRRVLENTYPSDATVRVSEIAEQPTDPVPTRAFQFRNQNPARISAAPMAARTPSLSWIVMNDVIAANTGSVAKIRAVFVAVV